MEELKRYPGMLNSSPSFPLNFISSNNFITLPLVILSIFVIVIQEYLQGPETHFCYEAAGEKELCLNRFLLFTFFSLLFPDPCHIKEGLEQGTKLRQGNLRCMWRMRRKPHCIPLLWKRCLSCFFFFFFKHKLISPLIFFCCACGPMWEEVKIWKLKNGRLLDKTGCTEASINSGLLWAQWSKNY